MRKGESGGGETRGAVIPVTPFKQKEKRALGPENNYSLLSGDSSEKEPGKNCGKKNREDHKLSECGVEAGGHRRERGKRERGGKRRKRICQCALVESSQLKAEVAVMKHS